MNWILSAFFLIFVFSIYTLVGRFIFNKFDIKNNLGGFPIYVIVGFIVVGALQWAVGFPAQLLHLSWNTYFFVLLVVYILFFSYTFYDSKKHSISFKLEKNKFGNHLKKYWFLYFLVIIFSFFSITSQLPYFEMNYDDHYYIGRIVQEIGTAQLATENYYVGHTDVVSFDRLLTTYEIGYGFWSELFGIYPAFFARATMVIHNYMVVFLSFISVGSMFIANKKNVQYVLIPFLLLLIPAGYLFNSGITRMYDGWQLNTAIWYGSSIVRMAMLPCMLITIRIFIRNKLYGFLSLSILCVAMLGYSAIAVTIGFLGVIAFILSVLILNLLNNKNPKIKLLSLLGIILAAIILYTISNIEYTSDFFVKSLGALGQFELDNEMRVSQSFILGPTIFFGIMMLIIADKKEKIYAATIMGTIFVFLITPLKFVLSLSSFGYFFVISRAFTATQVILLLLTGVFFVYIIDSNKRKVLPVMATGLLIITVVFQVQNLSKYKENVFLGSGISNYGYSVSRALQNQYMVPNVYFDFGEYLKKQPEERYQIIGPQLIEYEGGALHFASGMIMTANNVEMCNAYRGQCQNIEQKDNKFIESFLTGNLDAWSELQRIVEDGGIDFIATDKIGIVNFLENQGFLLVVESNSLKNEKVYLVDMR